MKKITLILFLLSLTSVTDRVVAYGGTTLPEEEKEPSNEDASSHEESDDSDGDEESSEVDQDENLLDLDGSLEDLSASLIPRYFFAGEAAMPNPLRRRRSNTDEKPEEEAEEKPNKRRRVEPNNNSSGPLGTPVPAEGGILGQLLESGFPTWHDPFFEALAPLDILSLYAASNRAHLRMRNDLALVIRDRVSLRRLLSLPLRSHAFHHLSELRFEIFDCDEREKARILRFLEGNAEVLIGLQRLRVSFSQGGFEDIELFQAALRNRHFANLLLQTDYRLDVPMEEDMLGDFVQQLSAAQRLQLNFNLHLLLFDRHQWFLAQVESPLSVRGLQLEGAEFVDETMRLFGMRLAEGRFPHLRFLEMIMIGLESPGYRMLGQIMRNGWLNELQTFEVDEDDAEGLTPEDALESLFSEWPSQGDLSGILPHLTEFAFLAQDGVISEESMRALAHVLHRGAFASLTTLTLRGGLNAASLLHLLQIAPDLQRLQTLNLRGNWLPDDAIAVIEALKAALPGCKVWVNE